MTLKITKPNYDNTDHYNTTVTGSLLTSMTCIQPWNPCVYLLPVKLFKSGAPPAIPMKRAFRYNQHIRRRKKQSESEKNKNFTEEQMSWQDALQFIGRSTFSVRCQTVQFHTSLIAGSLNDGNVSATIVDSRLNVFDHRLFAVQSECILQVSIDNSQRNEILTIIRFLFVLAVPE